VNTRPVLFSQDLALLGFRKLISEEGTKIIPLYSYLHTNWSNYSKYKILVLLTFIITGWGCLHPPCPPPFHPVTVASLYPGWPLIVHFILTTEYQKQHGITNNTKWFREYYIIEGKKKGTRIPILLRFILRYINIHNWQTPPRPGPPKQGNLQLHLQTTSTICLTRLARCDCTQYCKNWNIIW